MTWLYDDIDGGDNENHSVLPEVDVHNELLQDGLTKMAGYTTYEEMEELHAKMRDILHHIVDAYLNFTAASKNASQN